LEDSITKKLRVVRERSSNGEIHLILLESNFDESRKDDVYLDEAEMRITMKKEASKPLLILREA